MILFYRNCPRGTLSWMWRHVTWFFPNALIAQLVRARDCYTVCTASKSGWSVRLHVASWPPETSVGLIWGMNNSTSRGRGFDPHSERNIFFEHEAHMDHRRMANHLLSFDSESFRSAIQLPGLLETFHCAFRIHLTVLIHKCLPAKVYLYLEVYGLS